MLPKEEFKKEYESQLKNKLQSFDSRRKLGIAIDIVGFVPLIASFLILLPIAISKGAAKESMGMVAIGIFGGFGFLMLMKHIAGKVLHPLMDQFQEAFIKPIVQTISPDWQYSLDGSVGAIEVGASKLFDKRYDEFTGSNLVSGKIGKTDFRSSFLQITFRKSRPQDSAPHFGGFFFHADFNKQFKGETIVANGDLKDMADAFKNMDPNAGYVKLETAEFNKAFKVKSSDQTEARYILTPLIMEKLLSIQKQYGGPIRFSFVGKRVYCAINRTAPLFKLRPYKSINTWSFVEKIYDLFALNALLVEELNLNTRIWTKE